jgi:hypothetical protein
MLGECLKFEFVHQRAGQSRAIRLNIELSDLAIINHHRIPLGSPASQYGDLVFDSQLLCEFQVGIRQESNL